MKISFIGGGNMATALINGLAGKLVAGSDIHVVDVNVDALQKLKQQFGVSTSTVLDQQIAQVDVIVLAVKPQQLAEVMQQLRTWVSTQLIISIAAGVRLHDLSRWLGGYTAIVRTMPNMPALIGQGMTGMVAMSGVSTAQHNVANNVMSAVGATMYVDDESLLDVITAISGSGPAYVFYFMESMLEVGQDMGLTAEQATTLVDATFIGSAQLVTRSTDSAAMLREKVTSKGGTTYAAITSMQDNNVKQHIMVAVKKAMQRAQELGDELGKD